MELAKQVWEKIRPTLGNHSIQQMEKKYTGIQRLASQPQNAAGCGQWSVAFQGRLRITDWHVQIVKVRAVSSEDWCFVLECSPYFLLWLILIYSIGFFIWQPYNQLLLVTHRVSLKLDNSTLEGETILTCSIMYIGWCSESNITTQGEWVQSFSKMFALCKSTESHIRTRCSLCMRTRREYSKVQVTSHWEKQSLFSSTISIPFLFTSSIEQLFIFINNVLCLD